MRTLRLPQLPEMRCDRGCGDCCGPIAVPPEEYARVAAVVKARKIVPLRQGITCPLFIDGTCSVYEARPTICRLFGHSHKVLCSRGYNVNTDEATERVYAKALARGGTANARSLHELVYTGEEFEVIWKEYLNDPTPPPSPAPALGDAATGATQ